MHQSDDLTTSDITVLTCWDENKLDMGRVGITVNTLRTNAAKKRRQPAQGLSTHPGPNGKIGAVPRHPSGAVALQIWSIIV